MTTDWDLLRGTTCSCPPRCTTGNMWGDGPRDCSPDCEPCRRMRGKPYSPPAGHRAERHDVTCEQCCNTFVATMPNARFCGDRCRQRHHRGHPPGRCREHASRAEPESPTLDNDPKPDPGCKEVHLRR